MSYFDRAEEEDAADVDLLREEVLRLLRAAGVPASELERANELARACLRVCAVAMDRGEGLPPNLQAVGVKISQREFISIVGGLCAVSMVACLEDFIASTPMDGATIKRLDDSGKFGEPADGNPEARVMSRLRPSTRKGGRWFDSLRAAFGVEPSDPCKSLLNSLVQHRNHFAHGGFGAVEGVRLDENGKREIGVVQISIMRVQGWSMAAHALALGIVASAASSNST